MNIQNLFNQKSQYVSEHSNFHFHEFFGYWKNYVAQQSTYRDTIISIDCHS